MTIKVKQRIGYGAILYDAINDTACKLLHLLGQKTFSKANLIELKDIGFNVEIERIDEGV